MTEATEHAHRKGMKNSDLRLGWKTHDRRNLSPFLQTHRHGKQACGYQREEGHGEGQISGVGLTDTNYYM